MVRDRADLHMHSRMSDGEYSPTELVRQAERLQLGGIALTDHDTLEGLREFLGVETSDPVERVPGIEISTELSGMEIHILGYFIKDTSIKLQTQLRELQESRIQRIPKILEKLRELGIDITTEEMEKVTRGVPSPGRPHVARILVQKGVTASIEEAFEKYLGTGRPAYVRKARMESGEAVSLLSEIGGVPVLAHPFTIKTANLRMHLVILREKGLKGIEVDYIYEGRERQPDLSILRRYAEDLDLIATGGSDFHGVVEGAQLGEVTVPLDVIVRLKEASDY